MPMIPRIRHAVLIGGLLIAAVAPATIVTPAAQRREPPITAGAWADADRKTRRLSPDAFGALPASIRKELVRLGCTIPQTSEEAHPHNVISGRFTSSSGTDWAVLCSRARVSSILVFRKGETTPIELADAPDLNYLQGLGGSAIGFSRAISVASPRSIRAYYVAHGGPTPPRLDHDGIEDAFVGKASTVLYFRSGNWLELAGSD